MPSYNYIVRNRSGRISRGELQAKSPIEVRSRLNAMELRLVSLEEKPEKYDYLAHLQSLNPIHWLPIRSRDVELFLHQLAIMLRSGLKLLDAIKSLQMQSERRPMARLLESVHHQVSEGDSLSQALSRHKAVLPIVVQMVEIGEQTGSLDDVLIQARDYLAGRRSSRGEILIALAYPSGVAIAAFSIATYLVVVVIPQLQVFLSSVGKELPAMTQSLLNLATWLRLNIVNLVVSILALITAFTLLYFSPRGRLLIDRTLLRLPLIGNVLRLAGTTGLASSLALMLQSGIRLVDAVRIARRVQSNRHLARILSQASKRISGGHPLAPELSGSDGFSPILSSMIEVAERAGNMDKTMQEVASFCQAELKSRLKRLTQMLEPAVIFVAGGVVGYVYVAFFMALMSVGGNFK